MAICAPMVRVGMAIWVTRLKIFLVSIVFILRRRVVDDVRTYWQTTTERFFIPNLSLEAAKIN